MKNLLLFISLVYVYSSFSQDIDSTSSVDVLIVEKTSNSKSFVIKRFEMVKIREKNGKSTLGYFFENNGTEIVIVDGQNNEYSHVYKIQIQNIEVLYHYKSKPENRFGNTMIVSGISTSSVGAIAFILGSIGNATKSNFLFNQGSMILGGLLFPLGVLQVLSGKELNCNTYKISKGKYKILKKIRP